MIAMLTPNKRIEDLQPYLQYKYKQLVAECAKQGIKLQLIETKRSQVRQTEIFEEGTGPRLLGPHGFGCAFDAAPLQEDGSLNWKDTALFEKMGAIGKKLGLAWGGDWKRHDCPHFEYRGGLTDKQLRAGKLPKFPPIPTAIKNEGGLNIMSLNLKPICKGRISEKTSTLPCCSEPDNDKRTGSVLRKGKNEPFNIYAKAHNDKENCDYYLVNVNQKCIQWVAAGYVILIL